MNYSEKLRDPRWQKKRLLILDRDKFTCKKCGSKTKTLHVHHLFYFKDIEPWDINDGFLITLCEECHEPSNDEFWSENQVIIDDIGILLNTIWKQGFDTNDLREIQLAISQAEKPDNSTIKCEFLINILRDANAENKIFKA